MKVSALFLALVGAIDAYVPSKSHELLLNGYKRKKVFF
jgi:hypothetical protein